MDVCFYIERKEEKFHEQRVVGAGIDEKPR